MLYLSINRMWHRSQLFQRIICHNLPYDSCFLKRHDLSSRRIVPGKCAGGNTVWTQGDSLYEEGLLIALLRLLSGKPQPKPANGLSSPFCVFRPPLQTFIDKFRFSGDYHGTICTMVLACSLTCNVWQIITLKRHSFEALAPLHHHQSPQQSPHRHSDCLLHLRLPPPAATAAATTAWREVPRMSLQVSYESFFSVHNLLLATRMNLTFTHSGFAPKLQIICKIFPYFRGPYIANPNNAFLRANPSTWPYVCIGCPSNRGNFMIPIRFLHT